MKKWLLKRLGVRAEGLSEAEREEAAQVIEVAARYLESHGAHGAEERAVELRAVGLQLIDVASRPYKETPVAR